MVLIHLTQDRVGSTTFVNTAMNFRVTKRQGISLPAEEFSTLTTFHTEAGHSPTSSAEVKNAWIYTSTPPIRLHGMMLS
jgi:hypothetical protein